MIENLLCFGRLDWKALIALLTRVEQMCPLPSGITSFAQGNGFPDQMPPLPEDRMMRGLVWTQWYFARNVFIHADEDVGCLPMSPATDNEERSRAVRLLYLGITVASTSRFMDYDFETKQFSAPTIMKPRY